MNEIIKTIENAKHIVVIAHKESDADSLGSASAMYTYFLTLHKKVSFFCSDEKIKEQYSFLPWVNKIRNSFASSADLVFTLDCVNEEAIGMKIDCPVVNIDSHLKNTKYGNYNIVDSQCISTTEVIYDFFKVNDIYINKKMATSLYAGLVENSNSFLNKDIDPTTFAMSRELLECEADYKACNKFIMNYKTLAGLRLKAIMLQNMKLYNDGKIIFHHVCQKNIQATGAEFEDCQSALKESLSLPTVKKLVFLFENADFTYKSFVCNEDFIEESPTKEILELINKEIEFGKK